MAKWQNDLMLDAAFDWIRARVTQETVCSTQPTNYTQATSTYKLADTPMGSTDLVVADGDAGGRKVTIAAKNGVTVDASGGALHVALAGSTASILLYVTTCSSQQLTSGNTVNIPAWKITLNDAA